MNQQPPSQLTMLEDIPGGNSGMLPLELPEGVSPAPLTQSFVRARDDAVEIYCTRAARRMLPSEAFRDVLGGDVNNCDETCNPCKGCYG